MSSIHSLPAASACIGKCVLRQGILHFSIFVDMAAVDAFFKDALRMSGTIRGCNNGHMKISWSKKFRRVKPA